MKILINERDIKKRVKELARAIESDYKDRSVILIGILKGAAIFLADLIRELRIPLELDFIKVSSYLSGDKSSGRVRIFETGSLDIKAKDVIIVEDIVDTGLTLRRILQRLRPYKPKSLEVCVLLDKKDNRKVDLRLKYIGFEIPNIFVVGYGLDFVNRYRNIPYIGVLNGRSRKS